MYDLFSDFTLETPEEIPLHHHLRQRLQCVIQPGRRADGLCGPCHPRARGPIHTSVLQGLRSFLKAHVRLEKRLLCSFTHTFAAGEIPSPVLWHPVLNQILVGMRDGSVKIFYDPEISVRGACIIEGRTVLFWREFHL